MTDGFLGGIGRLSFAADVLNVALAPVAGFALWLGHQTCYTLTGGYDGHLHWDGFALLPKCMEVAGVAVSPTSGSVAGLATAVALFAGVHRA